MAVTADQIARLRRMINEPDGSIYSDEELQEYIEGCPLPDTDGRYPDHEDWEERYDLNRVAAKIWEEKAAALSPNYDINTDGSDLKRSQAFDNAKRMSQLFRSRCAIGSVRLTPTQTPNADLVDEFEDI